jgi:transglutaminase-like putative cysteine protease
MLAPVTFDYAIRLSYEAAPGAAFVLCLLPARTHQQQLAMERLRVRGASAHSVFTDAATATRYLHVAARGGALEIELGAQVRLLQAEIGGPALHRDVHARPLGAPESLRFLLPSRYCPSDRLAGVAEREFLSIEPPFERAVAIDRFVRRHLRVRRDPGAVPGATVDAAPDAPGAAEVLERAEGSPRDLAHLAIALCRASRLPARYVTAVPFGLAGATDVHPWVEVLVGDTWLAVDPSRLVPRTALLRLGTGRDAADVPLAIAHGAVSLARAEWSIACPGTRDDILAARDRGAEAIVTATLGSLGEATRWHQEARLASRRRDGSDDVEPSRPPPSRLAADAARAATTVPRAAAQVLVFPTPSVPGLPRSAGEPADSRIEPL